MINYMTVVLSIIQLAAFLIHSERVSPAFRMDRAAVSCSFGSWGFDLLPNTRTFFFSVGEWALIYSLQMNILLSP